MSRINALLFALLALLGVGLIWVANRPAGLTESQVEALFAAQAKPSTDVAAVTQIVADVLAKQKSDSPPHSDAQLDAETLNPLIEDYLLSNPRILQRVSEALELEIKTAQAAETRAALASLEQVIYDDPDHVVLGNPAGDVTLVELFDYNCGYCRSAVPDMATLLAEDPNLRIILKEFPILSQGSVDAAKVAVVVARDKSIDYWKFHQALFTSRGQVTKDSALDAARAVGLNPVEVGLAMESSDVDAVIEKSFEIAQGLNVSGTPTYIIGDEVIPGAIGLDALRERIANMRACGSTECPA
jgi:protein-disulfide isomerase